VTTAHVAPTALTTPVTFAITTRSSLR
jgi:hypothetical protein